MLILGTGRLNFDVDGLWDREINSVFTHGLAIDLANFVQDNSKSEDHVAVYKLYCDLVDPNYFAGSEQRKLIKVSLGLK